MDDYLRQKLLNPNNFGPNGIVNCDIQLRELVDISTVQAIEQQECDIIFTGSFSVDTLSSSVVFDVTSIPILELSNIKTWSEKCLSNLVIITQNEANLWGYFADDLNDNPNRPAQGAFGLSIFDGPFGNVNSFNQGGSFQGVFSNTPSTNFTLLGVDANNRPTAVLDSLTNDIIMGDVGIFCGNGVGDVSQGPNINNNNDRLVCNIFSLGCDIVNSGNIFLQTIEICNGSNYIRPNGGLANTEGIYYDTLRASNFCDSIIQTELMFADTIRNNIEYEGCINDGYSVIVNDVIYDQLNNIGTELLKSINGCDSLIAINLSFLENSDSLIIGEYCSGDTYNVTVGSTLFDEANTTGEVKLVNSNGCDSIVNVQLFFSQSLPEIGLDKELNIIYGEEYGLALNLANNMEVLWEPESAVDCSNCLVTNLNTLEYHPDLTVTIMDDQLCTKKQTIKINYQCPIYIPNIFYPPLDDAENSLFKLGTTCPFDNFDIKIYDRWGAIIFQSNDPVNSWDGKLNNSKLSQGLYLAVVKYEAFGNQYLELEQITMVR